MHCIFMDQPYSFHHFVSSVLCNTSAAPADLPARTVKTCFTLQSDIEPVLIILKLYNFNMRLKKTKQKKTKNVLLLKSDVSLCFRHEGQK